MQLNLGLSDPLLPPPGQSPVRAPRLDGPHLDGPRLDEPRLDGPRLDDDPEPDGGLLLVRGPRTLIVAGDGSPSDGARALALAAASGWPLLAEPTSHARGGPQAVGPYRLLLDHPELGGAVERVVVIGRPTLSRPVSRVLGDERVDVVLVSDHLDWPQPGRPVVRARRVGLETDPSPTVREGERRWVQRWRRADDAARPALDRVLAATGGLNGPVLAREVAAALGPGQLLVVGSSNPVRDLDLAAHPHPQRPLLAVTNRGLAGIDGTVATATGMALAHPGRGPVRVLLGDLAFLHDVGALLADPGELADARARGMAGAVRPGLQIVVLDDGGGGIFSLLEYGQRAAELADDPDAGDVEATRFERLFGTPHQVDLAALCAGYGVPSRRAGDLAGVRAALADPPAGTSVLAVPADRGQLRGLHAAIRTAVGEALSW